MRNTENISPVIREYLPFSSDDLHTILDANPFFPDSLIDFLDGLYPNIYHQSVGVVENYTLRQHTYMVMNQFEKYFSRLPLPGKIEMRYFRLFLAMHDIGKPDAIAQGNKYLQFQYNAAYIKKFFHSFGVDAKHTNLATALASGDPIGEFILKRKTPLQTMKKIRQKAREAIMPVEDFFQLQCIFFQVDAGSYTRNAGGHYALDKHFHFDEKNKKLAFAKHIQKRVDLLDFNVL
ncbi:MAG: hypothetical protein KDE26_19710 [Bacteroidetes bacterium]|nr:hypothetical protein [Bacteroidota bacterium]